jgi:hypothetical protein
MRVAIAGCAAIWSVVLGKLNGLENEERGDSL